MLQNKCVGGRGPLEGPLEPQSIFKSGKYKIKALLQFSEKIEQFCLFLMKIKFLN